MVLVDAHLHLADDAFCKDIDVVLRRAQDSGVSHVVNVTTTAEELARSFVYSERFSAIQFSHVAGTPPQDAQQDIESNFRHFYEAAHAGKLAAIGEIGLDYRFVNNEAAILRQKEVLRRYLNLALECDLPLVIHCRDVFDDFFHILDRYYSSDSRARPGMLHCFTGNLKEAHELLARGWFLSISGIVTFKNAQNLRDIVTEIPSNHLLIETDAPFLAPSPHRGKKNEPAYILHTINTVAQLKQVSSEEMRALVHSNLLRFL
ncbi:TatD family hydrolase [Candidatus Chlamydia sanziniae]|uniref:Putative deoxyribonuclease YcfH n=1 Tax=Candidatus Chlamydia sanziniae TaxID=1806891 RepID=A0A1A9HUC4_9CHLA|nr:TatD family hydrolase [Candidatus Chlamydia sanziniae]ANH78588.1 Putative deoxyribonuclease YcfH [Candidatus Chlamydia sanziniae]